jgi:hypothetical protein
MFGPSFLSLGRRLCDADRPRIVHLGRIDLDVQRHELVVDGAHLFGHLVDQEGVIGDRHPLLTRGGMRVERRLGVVDVEVVNGLARPLQPVPGVPDLHGNALVGRDVRTAGEAFRVALHVLHDVLDLEQELLGGLPLPRPVLAGDPGGLLVQVLRQRLEALLHGAERDGRVDQ